MSQRRRAQVSVEFIILVGLMLLIAVSLLPHITKQNELNKAVAAARDGATYGAGIRGLGFTSGNDAPEGKIRINNIEIVDEGECGDLHCYSFKIHILAPAYIKSNLNYSTTVGQTILTQSKYSLYYAFNGEYPDGAAIGRINTSYYSFGGGYTFD